MVKVPITKPVFDQEDLRAVQEPLTCGWIVQGPRVAEFEARFADFTGAKNAVACSSCTTGLHIALAALGIGPGDEVIVPAFTWISTANVVEYCGATPVFCDIDPATFNIDVNALAEKITSRTKAIIPVHLFGVAADMDAILALAGAHRLKVVEDAACGFGARIAGRHVGTFGEFGVFSFHPRKAITTGEGGMILSADLELATIARSLRDHGAERSDLSRHQSKSAFLLPQFNMLGFNYRMTDIQGALGIAQMNKAARIQEQRSRRAQIYNEELGRISWLGAQSLPPGSIHGYQAFVCMFQPEPPSLSNYEKLGEMRDSLMAQLEDLGIATRQGTHSVPALGYYREKYKIRPETYPHALIADRLTITLPLYAEMTDEEQQYVMEKLALVGRSMRLA